MSNTRVGNFRHTREPFKRRVKFPILLKALWLVPKSNKLFTRLSELFNAYFGSLKFLETHRLKYQGRLKYRLVGFICHFHEHNFSGPVHRVRLRIFCVTLLNFCQ